jgi:type IV pilus assembly protein PilP
MLRSPSRVLGRAWPALALVSLVLACDSSDAVISNNGPPPTAPVPGAVASTKSTPAQSEMITRAYRDSDFVESEQNRDPFRNYATELRLKAPVVAQRLVLMPDTSIEEMKLIAIVSGIDQPCAMIVDQRGVGYVTTRGDFVGKADVVQGGGSESLPVALNWRIDRIRVNEVVLAREDPSAPNRPPLTRVIPLHEDDPAIGVAAKTNG